MKELLKEKIILEEPEDKTLPDAKLDEPVVISTKDEDTTKMFINSFTDVLSSEIANIYDNISGLKSILVTLTESLPEKTEIADIINELINERTVHVGMIQKAIGLLDENHEELVDAGKDIATTIASEPEANDLNKSEE